MEDEWNNGDRFVLDRSLFPGMDFEVIRLHKRNSSLHSREIWKISINDVFGITLAALAPITIIGNLLVLIAFYRFRKLRTTTNLLIGSLAMADLMLGCVTLPLYVSFYFHGEVLSKIKYLCLVKYSFALGTMSASLISLVMIAFDRYLAVTRPLKYRMTMTKKKGTFMVLGIWIYDIFVFVLPLMGWNNYDKVNHNGTHNCNFFRILPVPYTVFTTPVVIAVSLSISVCFYFKIYMETVRHNKRKFERNSFSSDRSFGLRQFKKDAKSAKMMGIVSVLFFIFWFPFVIGSVMKYFSVRASSTEVVKNIVLTLAMSNSAVNPFIYCWMRGDFRVAFVMIICCKKGYNLQKFTSMKQNLGTMGRYSQTSHDGKHSPFIITSENKPLKIMSSEESSSYANLSISCDIESPNSVFSQNKLFPFDNAEMPSDKRTISTQL